jgi:ribosomal protein S18 acetylase RimI-like enzyme
MLRAVFEIRAYSPADRRAVRSICHLTGYMGEPADWFWRDRASFADLFSAYYTDHEAGSAYVVTEEVGGKVVGYLLGCPDSSRKPKVNRTLVHHLVGRALLLRPGTAGTLWRGFADLTREVVSGRGIPDDSFADDRYPSHFHIDLLPATRGSGVGHRLVKTFLEQLVTAGSPGVHVETVAQNEPAIRFFNGLGFEPTGSERPLPGWRTRSGVPMSILVMTRQLP